MKQFGATRGFSFEFFPPKTEAGRKRLSKTIHRLAPLNPSFVSVTFGAGGSTREGSFQTASEALEASKSRSAVTITMLALEGDALGKEELGIELATRQAEELRRSGAPGIHFYTLNRAEPTLRVWNNLGLPGTTALQAADAPATT